MIIDSKLTHLRSGSQYDNHLSNGNAYSATSSQEHTNIVLDLRNWKQQKAIGSATSPYLPKYRQAFFRSKWWILAAMLTTNFIWILVSTFSNDPDYSASTKLEFNQPIAAEKKEILTTDLFLEKLSDSLSATTENISQSIQFLKDNISGESSPFRTLLTITFQDLTPEGAALTANLAGKVFIEYLNTLYLINPDSRLATLRRQLEEARKKEYDSRQTFEVFRSANPRVNISPYPSPSNQTIASLQQSLNQLTRDIDLFRNSLVTLKSNQTIEEKNAPVRTLLSYMVSRQLPDGSNLTREYNNLYNEREQIKRRQYYTQDLQFTNVNQKIETLYTNVEQAVNNFLNDGQIEKKKVEGQLDLAQNRLSYSQRIQKRFNELQRDVEICQENVQKLQAAYNQAKNANGSNYANGRIIQKAIPPPQKNTFIPELQTILKSSFLGLMLSLMVVSLITYRDNTVKYPAELENILNIPVLAEIPEDNPSLFPSLPKAVIEPVEVNSHHTIQNLQITLSPTDRKEKNIILVTGSEINAGQTRLTAQLAQAFAASHQPTLLIDGNLRNGSLPDIFDAKPAPGLSDLINSNLEIKAETLSRIIQKTAVSNVYLISAGKPPDDPAALLSHPRVDILLGLLKQHFSTIIIDTPPLASASDAFIFKRHVNNTILVAQYGQTGILELQHHLKHFVINRLPLRGIVITGVPGIT